MTDPATLPDSSTIDLTDLASTPFRVLFKWSNGTADDRLYDLDEVCIGLRSDLPTLFQLCSVSNPDSGTPMIGLYGIIHLTRQSQPIPQDLPSLGQIRHAVIRNLALPDDPSFGVKASVALLTRIMDMLYERSKSKKDMADSPDSPEPTPDSSESNN